MTFWKFASAIALLGMFAPLDAAPPPDGERELCRLLERSLDDGETLGIQRCWSVRFNSDGATIRIEGEQSKVVVEAPAALAALARLEEKRVESGIFPLVLGLDGLVADNGTLAAGATLGEAREVATAMIARIETDPASADAMRQFVGQVAAASAQYMGRIPRDLFYPVAIDGAETILVVLPDGSNGQVTIDQSAVTQPGSGLLVSLQRRIVTEVGGTRNQSVETWVLSPAA